MVLKHNGEKVDAVELEWALTSAASTHTSLLWQHMTDIANVMKMSSAPPCDCDMGVLMHAVHSVFRVYI